MEKSYYVSLVEQSDNNTIYVKITRRFKGSDLNVQYKSYLENNGLSINMSVFDDFSEVDIFRLNYYYCANTSYTNDSGGTPHITDDLLLGKNNGKWYYILNLTISHSNYDSINFVTNSYIDGVIKLKSL